MLWKSKEDWRRKRNFIKKEKFEWIDFSSNKLKEMIEDGILETDGNLKNRVYMLKREMKFEMEKYRL